MRACAGGDVTIETVEGGVAFNVHRCRPSRTVVFFATACSATASSAVLHARAHACGPRRSERCMPPAHRPPARPGAPPPTHRRDADVKFHRYERSGEVSVFALQDQVNALEKASTKQSEETAATCLATLDTVKTFQKDYAFDLHDKFSKSLGVHASMHACPPSHAAGFWPCNGRGGRALARVRRTGALRVLQTRTGALVPHARMHARRLLVAARARADVPLNA